ncbi:DExH-box ATP-dependent RNA helicase DExH10 [Zea mays]|uniref:DExH-box ATP-dependent RNA helicase DExH10 n=1 Tax=Zea mays TaxID=4577 RepID=A0A317YC71_MAIZE|nr:DExH-box ATP-dependent RNA helicase DExH10 [Zea mays]
MSSPEREPATPRLRLESGDSCSLCSIKVCKSNGAYEEALFSAAVCQLQADRPLKKLTLLAIEGDSCKCSPPKDMKKVRKQIVDHIYPWILECQEKGHAKVPSLGSKWMFRTAYQLGSDSVNKGQYPVSTAHTAPGICTMLPVKYNFRQALPEIAQKITRLENEIPCLILLARLAHFLLHTDLVEHHKLGLDISELEKKIIYEMMRPERTLLYLVPGRLVRVRDGSTDWGWGVLAGITFTGDPAKNKKDLFGAIAMVLRVVGGKNSQLSLPTRYSLNTIFTSLIGLFWNTNYEFGKKRKHARIIDKKIAKKKSEAVEYQKLLPIG